MIDRPRPAPEDVFDLLAQLAAMTEERDRLREALEEIQAAYDGTATGGDNALHIAARALAGEGAK